MSASVEAAMRDYLRGRPSLMALLNGEDARLNLEWTGNLKATHITLYRAGGGYDDYQPLQTVAITFHCHGTTRMVASDLAETLAAEVRRIVQGPLNDSVKAKSASVESLTWVPTSDGSPRYVVTTVVTATIPALAA